tara:strand:+ start:353 stop:634 length:282 start_codon:yes stop_codon:yes gene_type:complete
MDSTHGEGGTISVSKYSQTPLVGTIFHHNGDKYYIEKIIADTVTAKTFKVVDSESIILDKSDVEFSTSTLEMRGSLDVISFERVAYSNITTAV